MMNTRSITLIVAVIAAMSAVGPTTAWAVAGRTTPVEVVNKPLVGIETGNNIVQSVQLDPWYVNILGTPNFNVANSPTVKIDGTTNTVKSAQSGTWSVGLTGTPSVAQSGTWNVGVSSMPTVSVNTHAVTQSGAWNVGINNTPDVNIANTPSVSVSNSPTVRIDAAANAVVAASKHNTVQLSTSNVSIPASTSWNSALIDCAGYKEIRALLWSNTLSADILVYVMVRSPSGNYMTAKVVPFQGSAVMPINCLVYGDTCKIMIWNDSSVEMTLYRDSYVYLVN